jgi:hypothetical protein
MIVAASTTLLADSRMGGRGGCCRGRCWRWAAWRAWPPMSRRPSRRQRAGDRGVAVVRVDRGLRAADAPGPPKRPGQRQRQAGKTRAADLPLRSSRREPVTCAASSAWAELAQRWARRQGWCEPDLRRQAWQWALANRQLTARCRAGARSAGSMADTSGGATWSSVRVQQANSPRALSPANRVCAWSGSDDRPLRPNDRALRGMTGRRGEP